METSEFILEIVKVMVPVLTGLLVLAAKGIGALWEKKAVLKNSDYLFVTAIASFALLSFGCWAGALAGAVINSTGGPGSIYFIDLSSEEALLLARKFLTHAYNTFVISAVLSGFYYLSLLRQLNINSHKADKQSKADA